MYTSPRASLRRYGLYFAALASLVVGGAFWLDDSQGPYHRQADLACARENLEALWGVKLPKVIPIAVSEPRSRVASADWDLKELGCSSATQVRVTLDEIFGAAPPADISYTAALP